MYWMMPIFKPPHAFVDDLTGVFLTFVGEMQIDHGGFEHGMAQVALDGTDVDTLFQ